MSYGPDRMNENSNGSNCIIPKADEYQSSCSEANDRDWDTNISNDAECNSCSIVYMYLEVTYTQGIFYIVYVTTYLRGFRTEQNRKMCQVIAATHSYRRIRLSIDSSASFLTPETVQLILSTGKKSCVMWTMGIKNSTYFLNSQNEQSTCLSIAV